ncbi:hypothetical protein ACIBJC_02535 [Streptomyces sp. NPDC050509]|uniref:hypothetical protein n=1 Tax=Streptomyces sp. NPDC050509 TaxID=3365620 RepID=UPI00378D9E9F
MERFTSFDFGLSALTALFHEDWVRLGGVEGVVHSYLSVGEDIAADEAQRKEAAELKRDVTKLADSSLSDRRIETLVSMSTSWNYRFRDEGTGRTFLGRVSRVCQRWQDTYGYVSAEDDQAWFSLDAVNEVRNAIANTPLRIPDELRRYFESNVMEMRDALDVCAQSASPDLAFRILLRTHVSNFIPVSRDSRVEYEKIASRLALGEDLISSLDFLTLDTALESD